MLTFGILRRYYVPLHRSKASRDPAYGAGRQPTR